jgi:hypothetical protein
MKLGGNKVKALTGSKERSSDGRGMSWQRKLR